VDVQNLPSSTSGLAQSLGQFIATLIP